MRGSAETPPSRHRTPGPETLVLLGALLLAPCANGQPVPALLGDSSLFRIGILDLDAGTTEWQRAAVTLAGELRARTSVEPADDASVVRIPDRALFRTPLLVLSGDRAFPLPPAEEISRLRRFLTYGGLLLIDDRTASPGGAFDHSAKNLVRELFPTIAWTSLSSSHVLYKSFYLLGGPAGHRLVAPTLEAIERDDRILVLHSSNDLGTAVAARRDPSVRLAVNIVFYALCLNYKEDQVHTPFILRRRRARSFP